MCRKEKQSSILLDFNSTNIYYILVLIIISNNYTVSFFSFGIEVINSIKY